MNPKIILGFLSLFLCVACNHRNSKSLDCHKQNIDKYDVSWCIEKGSSNSDVIYYFHGLGSDEKEWNRSRFREVYLETATENSATVISISFGPRWFLTDISGLLRDSRLEVFDQKILPLLENSLGFKVQHRFLVGESMGGYNALRLAYDHNNRFDKVVAFCPAILTLSPFATGYEIALYKFRNPSVDLKILIGVTGFGLSEFPLPYLWERNSLLNLADSEKIPKVFMTSNSEDVYGFNEGSAIFADKLKSKNELQEYIPEKKSHCTHTSGTILKAMRFLNDQQ